MVGFIVLGGGWLGLGGRALLVPAEPLIPELGQGIAPRLKPQYLVYIYIYVFIILEQTQMHGNVQRTGGCWCLYGTVSFPGTGSCSSMALWDVS